MGRSLVIVLLMLVAVLALAPAAPAASSPKASADGSLLLEGADAKKGGKAAGGDTLYEVLGKEVQVYIFNHKARIWPVSSVKSYTISPAWRGRVSDPRLEPLIAKYAGIYGIDPALVRAVVRHESGFNPAAVSPKGAQGVMQLMPGTAALMGVRDPFDPEQNIAGGVGYLRYCLDRFQHQVPLAVAAYNAGPESVAKYGTIPPYAETQLFVNNVMGTYGCGSPASAAKKAPAAKAAKGKAAAKAAAASSKEASGEDKPKRRGPKVIEVRSKTAKKVLSKKDN